MTHPFDEIAVDAAEKARAAAWEKYPILRDGGVSRKHVPIEAMSAALSAAFKSARERGVAREGLGYRNLGHRDREVWTAQTWAPEASGSPSFPVTIIRHRENEHE